jgi:hypothetical protein
MHESTMTAIAVSDGGFAPMPLSDTGKIGVGIMAAIV